MAQKVVGLLQKLREKVLSSSKSESMRCGLKIQTVKTIHEFWLVSFILVTFLFWNFYADSITGLVVDDRSDHFMPGANKQISFYPFLRYRFSIHLFRAPVQWRHCVGHAPCLLWSRAITSAVLCYRNSVSSSWSMRSLHAATRPRTGTPSSTASGK